MTTYSLAEEWPENKNDWYRVNMYCINCEHTGLIRFPKGARATGLFSRKPVCPNCGCRSLEQMR